LDLLIERPDSIMAIAASGKPGKAWFGAKIRPSLNCVRRLFFFEERQHETPVQHRSNQRVMEHLESISYDDLMSRGMAASQANDGPQAIEWFLQASAVQPGSGLPQFLLGSEFAALGQMDRAETAFANAALLAPEFPMARYQLGLLQFSSGRAATALLTWQPLLGLPQTEPLPHFVNGFAALAQDKFQEALQHYRQGLTLNTTNEALSGDIRKVIAGIEALPEAATGNMPSTEESNTHIFLANYQQQGRSH
jgi:tetratricopeptide (TPR) repeat protein